MVFYVSLDTLHTATGALVHAAGVLPDSALHGVSHTISIVSNEEEDHEDRYVIVSLLHFTVSVIVSLLHVIVSLLHFTVSVPHSVSHHFYRH